MVKPRTLRDLYISCMVVCVCTHEDVRPCDEHYLWVHWPLLGLCQFSPIVRTVILVALVSTDGIKIKAVHQV